MISLTGASLNFSHDGSLEKILKQVIAHILQLQEPDTFCTQIGGGRQKRLLVAMHPVGDWLCQN
jgi:hypothetical protein